MLIRNGEYSLIYHRDENRIIILLPQTLETIISSKMPVVERRTEVTSEMLGLLLTMAKYIFEKKEGET